jgi:hypothetical protein
MLFGVHSASNIHTLLAPKGVDCHLSRLVTSRTKQPQRSGFSDTVIERCRHPHPDSTRIVAIAVASVLRTEMGDLDPQEENTPTHGVAGYAQDSSQG